MNLYRFRLIPESPWLTPWQADTLSGMLCWAYARRHGGETLRREVLDPAMSGRPRFVLSDAFPGDWLPIPSILRLVDWPADQRKKVKRAIWLQPDSFMRVQRGRQITTEEMISTGGTHPYTQLRNSIGREGNAGSDGSGLFPKEERVLERGISCLTVYARIEPDFASEFEELVKELAVSGFGADVSAGKGQFRLASGFESADWLADPAVQTEGVVTLSTFQPGADDPTEGCWDAFTKYGKLGPDFGLENVFKRPLVLLRPGACFRTSGSRRWLGRAIAMHELLSSDTVDELHRKDAMVCHLAFGLCVPLCWTL